MIKRFSLLAVAGYLLAMVVMAPAWLLQGLPIAAAQLNGSLWQGSAYQLRAGGETLDSLSWRWDWSFGWSVQGESKALGFSAQVFPRLGLVSLNRPQVEMRLAGSRWGQLSGEQLMVGAEGCLSARGLRWSLTESVRSLLPSGAPLEGEVICRQGQLLVENALMRLAVDFEQYQPVVRQLWLAPSLKRVVGG